MLGCLLSGLVVALASTLVLSGCASQTTRGFPRAVLEEAEDAREELRGEMVAGTAGRPDPSMMTSMRERMDELNESTEDRLSELLTVEQMAEYEEIAREAEREMDAMRSQMSGMRGGPGGFGGKGGR